MRERLAGLDIAGEGQEGRAHRVVEPAVGDDHVEDRLRLVGDVLPGADRLEEPARSGDDRGGALVVVTALAERRVGDRDRERRPSA